MRSSGNITRDFPFDWIVFTFVSHNLRASHSPIVLKIRTCNFLLAATGIITKTRPPPSPPRLQLAALFFNIDISYFVVTPIAVGDRGAEGTRHRV